MGVLPPRFPPCCLLPLWVVSAAAWELASHFPLTFSFGVVVAPWFLVGVLQRFFPPGGFLLQFVEVGLPPLWRWRAWMAESSRPVRSSGRLPSACSCLSSSPLALHGVVSTSPVCLSRAPAFRQVRVAMLAEGSVKSPSVLVLAFHSSLFLVDGSSDGSAPGDRSSPLDGCVYSLRFQLSSVASALSLLGSWAFLPPLSVILLSDTVAPFLEETVRSSRRFYVFQSSTWWSSVGLGSYTFPGCSRPGLVGVLPLSGGATPVWSPACFWLLGASGRLASPLWLRAPSFSGGGSCGHQSSPCFLP